MFERGNAAMIYLLLREFERQKIHIKLQEFVTNDCDSTLALIKRLSGAEKFS